MHFSLAISLGLLASSSLVSARSHSKRAGTCKSKSSKTIASKASSTATASAAKSTTTKVANVDNSSAKLSKTTLKGANVNGIYFGVLPDDGSGGFGNSYIQKYSDLVKAAGVDNLAAQGWYAQVNSGTPWDGAQLLHRKDEILNGGGVFQPAVMPIGGWQGLTNDDDSQAKRICDILKEHFVDEGLEVWLRFAHEINWYQYDGTYQGGIEDFKQGWAAVAKHCQPHGIKMWYSPNVASDNSIYDYYPDDPSTVDIIGIDYYLRDQSNPDFVKVMGKFHDTYCNDRVSFAIGETGLWDNTDLSAQLEWAKHILSADVKKAMPYLTQVSWFNYMKETDFRILGKDGDSLTKNWLAGSS